MARVADYKAVFGSKVGEKVLHDMMQVHGMLSSTFDPNPYEMARKEGERNCILRILTILRVDMKELERKIKEAANASEAD